MMSTNEYMPNEVSAPGESLADLLEDLGMTQAELAKRVDYTEKGIREIIRGLAPITPELALKLEMVFGTPAHFWNERQAQYQEARMRQEVTSNRIDRR